MKTVTKKQFWAMIMDGLDVHPNPERMATYWRMRNGSLFGVSTPGYLGEGEATFKVSDSFTN